MIIIHVREDHIVEPTGRGRSKNRRVECPITVAEGNVPILNRDIGMSTAIDDHQIWYAIAVQIAGADVLQPALPDSHAGLTEGAVSIPQKDVNAGLARE